MNILQLNEDLICLILFKLKNFELWSFYTTCKYFYKMSRREEFWKKLSNLRFGNNLYSTMKDYMWKTLNERGVKRIYDYEVRDKVLFSHDFDLFMHEVMKWKSIPEINCKDNIEKLFYYIHPQNLKYIILRTNLETLVSLPYKASNLEIVKISFSNPRLNEYISSSQIAKVVLASFKNNDNQTMCFLFDYGLRMKNKYFLIRLLELANNKENINFINLIINYNIDIFEFMRLNHKNIQLSTLSLLWNYKKEEIIKFIKYILRCWKTSTIMRVYKKFKYIDSNEIRFMYLEYFSSLSSSKYRTREEQTIRYIEDIINDIDYK